MYCLLLRLLTVKHRMMGEVHEASNLKKERSICWLQQMDSDLECEVSASSKAPQSQVHEFTT